MSGRRGGTTLFSIGLLAALGGLAACGDASIGGTPATATPTVGSSRTPTPEATPTTSGSPGGTPGSSPTVGSSRTPASEATPTTSGSPGGTPGSSPTPGDSTSVLPDIVETGRVVFRSQSGVTCCIAVDPALLPRDPQPGQPSLVLIDLPIGPATVTISGYVEDFAPGPADATTTCNTLNTSGVASCDLSRQASPAYESAPKSVTILPGVRVNLGEIEVVALPFLLEYAPPQGGAAQSPVAIRFTVVDAETGIEGSSIALEVTFDAAQPPVTERIPLTLAACADASDEPCSPRGSLGGAGFRAQGTVLYPSSLPAGAVTVRITAQNLATPPRALDFSYRFTAAPQPTATVSVTPTVTPTLTLAPTSTLKPTLTAVPSATATASDTATAVPTPTTSPTASRTATPPPTRTARPTAVDTVTPTVTPTRTFTETPTPTPTTLCDTTPRGGCRNPPSAELRLKVAPGGDTLNSRWLSRTAPLAESGNPTATTTYALCIYDSVQGVPQLAFAAQIEPGGTCGRSPCWSTVGSLVGYRFVDSTGFQDGMERLLLRDRSAANDSIVAQGGGVHLKLPLPVGVDTFFAQQDNVVVQLVNDVGGCWESTFRPGDVSANSSALYEAAR